MDAEEILSTIWVPHEGQREFLSAGAKTRVLACGRRWGKTHAGAADVLIRTLRAACDDLAQAERTMIVGPTIDQARIIFDQIVEWIEELVRIGFWPSERPRIVRGKSPEIAIGRHRILAKSAHTPRSLRGHGATHIVVDEAAYVRDEVIRDVLMPMLATTDGRMTLLSTPRSRNFFAQVFDAGVQDAASAEPTGRIWCKNAPSLENPHVGREYVENQRLLHTERSFQTEYEAVFHDAAGSVFRAKDLDAALDISADEEEPGSVVIGVDWARTGDATGFAVVAGTSKRAAVLEVQRHHGLSFTEQRDRLAALLVKYPKAKVFADDTGLGLPVNELLCDVRSSFVLKGRPVERVRFTNATKADMVSALQIAFERRALGLVPDPALMRELSNFSCWTMPSGATGYGASSGHDDLVCALMLAVSNLSTTTESTVLISGYRRFCTR